METKTVKHRGRPNRGGGRFNRGRGRGSRGRGRGDLPTVHHGHGGRKAGDDYMYDADDGMDDNEDWSLSASGPNFQGRDTAPRDTTSNSKDHNQSHTFTSGRLVFSLYTGSYFQYSLL